jgi:hypothetical protein
MPFLVSMNLFIYFSFIHFTYIWVCTLILVKFDYLYIYKWFVGDDNMVGGGCYLRF